MGKEHGIVEEEQVSYTYEELCGLSFKFVPNCDRYKKIDGKWVDISNNEGYMKEVLANALDINICGIVKNTNKNAMETGSIGYTSALTEYIINTTNNSEIAKEQLANPTIDVFTGKPFQTDNTQQAPQFDMNNLTEEQMQYIASMSDAEKQYLMSLSDEQKMYLLSLSDEEKMHFASLSEEQKIAFFKTMSANAKNTYEDNIRAIGIMDLSDPWEINIYPKDFESKENITQLIKDYNKKYTDEGKEEYAIQYSDLVGTMMESVSDVVNIISIALMAFVSISLVVSSIMIGIITYISVLERTKEIGILRSIGASKRDISRVFNAETFIIGLVAGLLGIGITLLLSIPINIVIKNLTGVDNIAALPFMGAVILILISMMLTMISGFVPAKMAAKKDPVEALRTE